MCGIATIFSYRDGRPVSESELLAIRDRMTSRGPEGAGIWISPARSAGLAHRRLSILDLSPSGGQPMFDETGAFGISFNGEIYNYRELRAELEKRGFHFRSTSDTEVLLQLYADRGVDMLDCLRGMYAFAIWDDRQKSLFLARDPYGIKPLYYADDGKTFRAASQVKAPTPHQIQQGTPAFSFGATFRTRTRCIEVYGRCLPEVSFGSNAAKTGA